MLLVLKESLRSKLTTFPVCKAGCSKRNSSMMTRTSMSLAISVFQILNDIGLEKLWVAFGQEANLRWIPIHDIRHSIGPVKSNGIPFLHAFTCCYVVSAFHGKGKRAASKTWDVYPKASDVFAKLSMYPPVSGDEVKKILEKIVIIRYDRSSSSLMLTVSDWTCLPASRSHTMQYS